MLTIQKYGDFNYTESVDSNDLFLGVVYMRPYRDNQRLWMTYQAEQVRLFQTILAQVSIIAVICHV